MTINANSIVILTFAAGVFVPLGAIAEVPPEMKALEPFVDTWKMEQTMKTGDGRQVKTSGLTTTKFALDGRYIDWTSNSGEDESYGIITYDETKKQYRSWFFNSSGQHSEWSGTWDKAKKTLTRTANLGQGNGKAVSRFVDDDTFEFSLVGKDRDGKVFVEINSKFSRQPDAKPVARKRSKERSTSPHELQTLDRLVGRWSDEGVMKVAVWTPEEVRFKSDSETFWILGGKYLFQKSSEAIFIKTYSATEKAVKMWHFNAAGYIHEWTGHWNDEKDVLTLRSDLDGNSIVSSVLKQTFNGNGTVSWSAIATDQAGRVYHHIEGTSKRQK